MAKKQRRRLALKVSAALALVITSTLIFAARGPDYTVTFERSVPLERVHIRDARSWLESPKDWAQWFHSGSQIQWSSPAAAQKLTPGATARLTVDPKKMSWKRYEISITLISVENTPDQLTVKIRLDGDSHGKVQRVFKDIYWTLSVRSSDLYGTATAVTQSWRSRLTSRLSARSVMNQIFYPHLFKLARLAEGTADSLIEGKKSLY